MRFGGAVQQGHGHHVLKHGTMRQQPAALHDVPDGSTQLVGVLVCDILPADGDCAFLRLYHAVDHAQGGGFTAS